MLISPTILPNLVIIGKRNVEIWTKLLKTTLLPAFSLWMDLYGELIMDLITKKHYLYLNNTRNAWNVLIYLTFFKVVTNIIASLRGTWSVHCVAYTFVNRYCYCIMCCYILSDLWGRILWPCILYCFERRLRHKSNNVIIIINKTHTYILWHILLNSK